MVRIRLQRHGRKKLPYYHIVAADVRSKRDGRIIEDLGRFSPTMDPALIRLETDRVIYWLKKGAQPSNTVHSILKKEGIFYRLHLERWGKSQEEIGQTIEEWKQGHRKKDKVPTTKAQRMKDQLKAEEAVFQKEQEARIKAEAEKAAAQAEAARKAEEQKAIEAEKLEAQKAEGENDGNDTAQKKQAAENDATEKSPVEPSEDVDSKDSAPEDKSASENPDSETKTGQTKE